MPDDALHYRRSFVPFGVAWRAADLGGPLGILSAAPSRSARRWALLGAVVAHGVVLTVLLSVVRHPAEQTESATIEFVVQTPIAEAAPDPEPLPLQPTVADEVAKAQVADAELTDRTVADPQPPDLQPPEPQPPVFQPPETPAADPAPPTALAAVAEPPTVQPDLPPIEPDPKPAHDEQPPDPPPLALPSPQPAALTEPPRPQVTISPPPPAPRSPPRAATARPVLPKAAAALPAPVQARVAPDGGAGAKADQHVAEVLEGRIRSAVQAAVHCPAAARMMGQSGKAGVAFDYRDGAVAGGLQLARSSGVPMLDTAALTAVRDAHYPAAPPEVVNQVLHLLVWVEEACGG